MNVQLQPSLTYSKVKIIKRLIVPYLKYYLNKRWLSRCFRSKIFQLIVTLCSFSFLIITFHEKGWEHISAIKLLNADTLALLLVCLLLMPVNYFFEASKWRFLLVCQKIHVSMKRLVMAVFYGVSTQFWLPKYIGDPMGRSMILNRSNHSKIVSATYLGQFCQMVPSILMGVVVLLFTVIGSPHNDLGLLEFNTGSYWIMGGSMATGMIVFIGYHKGNFFPKIKEKLNTLLKPFEAIGYRHVLKGSLLRAFFRYSIFILQYILVLKAFSIDLSLLQYVQAISLVYFIKTLIPVWGIAGDLGAREVIIISVFGMLGYDLNHDMVIALLGASMMLWFINLFLPALMGVGSYIMQNKVQGKWQ